MDGVTNVTGQEDCNTGLWNWDYLITCFKEEKICVSFGLWLLSCLFWFTSFSLHFYLRCKRKSRQEELVFWNIYSFFGSMCNTIGSLLSKQLTIQVITGAYMALSDVVNFILTLFPVCKSNYRVRASHRPSRRKKHRKPILSALSLCMMISLGYYSLQENAPQFPEASYSHQRKLLGTVLQERVDVVGFTLGIIAVLVSWTVRVPVITKVISHWTPLNMLPNRSLGTGASLGRYVRLSIEQVQQDGIGPVRLPGDGQTNPVTVQNKEPLGYFDLPVYPPTCVTHSSSSSSDKSSNTTDLEWDFEDLHQNWNGDSEVPNIQPSDSSVLNVAHFNSESQFPSTLWPRYKNFEISYGKKKVQPSDKASTEQRSHYFTHCVTFMRLEM
ncbi:transmembrane protein 44 isoform 3-T3 [Mantella aurantiaca]